MAYWLGMTVAIAMLSMLNPIIWISAIYVSRWTEHLGSSLELGFYNLLSMGPILFIGGMELGQQSFDFYQLVIGSILAGGAVHFVVHFIRFIYRRRKILASGALAAANVVTDSASSQLDRIKPFRPDNYDDASYEKAMKEIDSGQLKKSTWAKSIAVSKGDMAKAQANYIVLRVKEIANP